MDHFFVMMAAFAELERDMIRERSMAGMAAASAQGRTGGRPTVMDADTLAAARARRANGESPTQIAPKPWESPVHPFTATCPPATPEPCRPNRFLGANHCSPADQAPSTPTSQTTASPAARPQPDAAALAFNFPPLLPRPYFRQREFLIPQHDGVFKMVRIQ